MWQFLLHLWAMPPGNLELASCPAPAAGQPPDPQGFYDATTVLAAFNLTALVSVLLVVVGVVVCYQLTRGSLGGSFVKRWWLGMGIVAVVCVGAAWLTLATYPTTALANTCSTNPDAFAVALPASVVMGRALWGGAWGALAYLLVSIVLTATLGRLPGKSNGFFHSRGCPVPRFLA